MRSLFFDFDEGVAEREIQIRENESEFTMRPYQAEAVRNVFREWDSGVSATLVCMPTGGGKTVVFSEVMRQFAERN